MMTPMTTNDDSRHPRIGLAAFRWYSVATQLRVPRSSWDYEHILRNADEANRIHLYIESNPVNWAEDEENK
jgi:hypothetical protein